MSGLDRRAALLTMASRIDRWLDDEKDDAAWVNLGIMLSECRQLLREVARAAQ